MNINLKSAVIGLLIGIVAILVVGAGEEPAGKVGKYQITGGSGFFVIISTETGQAWFANMASPGVTGIGPDFWNKKPDR